jgi:haloalkane dehalogenase
MDAQTTVPPTSFGLPSIVTVVPPALASALDEAALELLDEDSLELDDDDDPDEDLSPDEQPARPATTIAAPPTATSKLCFTTVLLLSLQSVKIKRIVQGSMGCHPPADMRLREKLSVDLLAIARRSPEGMIAPSEQSPGGKFTNMESLRTPEDRFAGLSEFPYQPHYCDVDDGEGGRLRVAWVEDGPAHADPVLLLHGEPSWSYLYRRMMPILAAAGHRVICPDLVGFGRSDKPTEIGDHSYARHVEWMRAVAFDELDLRHVTLVAQDWGGLIGLRLAAEQADRFARIVVANTGLPTGDLPMPDIWWQFRRAIQGMPVIEIGRFVQSGCQRPMSDAVRAAYDAPFPDDSYCAGPRAMPGLVPTSPDDPASSANRSAWKTLSDSPTPMLVAFSDGDPITGAMGPIFIKQMRGAQGIAHPVIHDAGHFLQEDAGEELAEAIVRFLS